jgi:hypothetical protein
VADEDRRPEEDERGYDDRPDVDAGESGPTEVDAMGKDKRRAVVGGQYGASARKQLLVYGAFFAVVIVLAIAFLTVVDGIDNREIALEDTGPWTEATAEQTAPRPIDFPRNGPTDTIPVDEINRAVPPTESDEETETETGFTNQGD